MTLRVSRDNGVTWESALAISGLPAAYSDLVELDQNTVGCSTRPVISAPTRRSPSAGSP